MKWLFRMIRWTLFLKVARWGFRALTRSRRPVKAADGGRRKATGGGA